MRTFGPSGIVLKGAVASATLCMRKSENAPEQRFPLKVTAGAGALAGHTTITYAGATALPSGVATITAKPADPACCCEYLLVHCERCPPLQVLSGGLPTSGYTSGNPLDAGGPVPSCA
jgi:hypothetical protein